MNKKILSRKLTVGFAVAAITAFGVCVALLTGCGGGATATAPEPEPIINPITGQECDSELPARPVMVSIPNAADGAVPQSNLSYADIIYEVPVEGQITRLQAVFYGQFPDKVGPIRSVRYYFVDLAREYKAAHVGYGWGKKAKSYMESCGIPHINGMQDTDLFYRVEDKQSPNDAYIDWSSIEERAEAEGWFSSTQTIEPFKFRDSDWQESQKQAKAEANEIIEEKSESDDPEDIQAVEDAKATLEEPETASSVTVKSLSCNSACTYNEETGRYDRTWYGEPYVDKETGEQLSFDNVLVQYVTSDIMTDSDTGLDDEKGRLEIDFTEGGDALLFTDGEISKGTWRKAEPDDRTTFTDENGKEFRFSQGTTWVYVVDQNMECTYE